MNKSPFMSAKVLIVEDEALIAAEIESTLLSMGYKVVGKAKNGDLALDLFKSTQPDIALLDIKIKGSTSGIDLAKIIKEKYHFPFIFLTSYADGTTLKEAGKTMPYGYIVKPFTDKDLRSNIEMALTRFAAEQQSDSLDIQAIQSKIKVTFTEREKEILRALLEGLTYKEIASKYFISVNTVKTYQKRIFTYFNVKSRHELVNVVRGK